MTTPSDITSFTPRPATRPRSRLAGPASVLRDPTMTVDEKRSLLASWASDARAVPDHPALRQLDDGSYIEIDDILYALKRLDAVSNYAAPPGPATVPIRRGHWFRMSRVWRWTRDDDDDDPPTPAPDAPRPRPPVLEDSGIYAAA